MLKKLYCDLRARLLGTLGRWADAGRAGRAWGARGAPGARAQAWALSAGRAGVLQACGPRRAQAGEQQARGARGARGARAAAGAGAREACGLGARAGCRLCTRCTRPIFDPF